MTLLRWLAAAAVAGVSTMAIHARFVVPCRCTAIERRTEQSTLRIAIASADPYVVSTIARANLSALAPCLRSAPSTNLLMITAANQRFLRRYDDAIASYERALRADRRPELYFNLGMTQIDAGNAKVGVENVIYACVFNPGFRSEVTLYREAVDRGVDLYQTHIEQLKQSQR